MIDNILKGIIICLYRIFHQPLTENKIKITLQFLKFCLVGFSNVVVSYVFYLIFFFLFGTLGIYGKSNYLTAQILGFVISIFWSFYWNHKYVFAVDRKDNIALLLSFFKMLFSYSITGIALNSALLILWIDFFKISAVIAPLINLVFCVPVNFLLNKYWAFSE